MLVTSRIFWDLLIYFRPWIFVWNEGPYSLPSRQISLNECTIFNLWDWERKTWKLYIMIFLINVNLVGYFSGQIYPWKGLGQFCCFQGGCEPRSTPQRVPFCCFLGASSTSSSSGVSSEFCAESIFSEGKVLPCFCSWHSGIRNVSRCNSAYMTAVCMFGGVRAEETGKSSCSCCVVVRLFLLLCLPSPLCLMITILIAWQWKSLKQWHPRF